LQSGALALSHCSTTSAIDIPDIPRIDHRQVMVEVPHQADRNRCSAANGRSVPAADVSTCSKMRG
jgi:hypothetical protein